MTMREMGDRVALAPATPAFHVIANCWPLVEGQEFTALCESIVRHGLLSPIVLYEGRILDGRNRYRACMQAGVQPSFEEYTGEDPVEFCRAKNEVRRHLDTSQRSMVAARLATLSHGGDRRTQAASLPVETQATAADKLKVSERSVRDAKKVISSAVPELAAAVDQGLIAVSTAASLADRPANEQRAVAQRLEQGLPAPKAIIETRRDAQRAHLNSIEVREAKAIEGVYDVVCIDPPWPMARIELDARPNQPAELDYPTMSLEEIAALEIPCADDAHVFLWTTHRFLPAAFELLKTWGLKYVCCFVWRKPGGFQPIGLPQYNNEFIVYSRKGTPEFLDTRDFATTFEAPRGKHSEKPELFYSILRRVTAGRRIDMFSRREIAGFETWGLEAPANDNAQPKDPD
jgi:N6-adenosine-specific RNA methylase IME4/ParB-like chromosome segregation protein Spo0J